MLLLRRQIVFSVVALLAIGAGLAMRTTNAAFGAAGEGFVSAVRRHQSATPVPPALTIPRIFFEENFGTYSGRWQLIESPKARVMYANEALRMQVTSPGFAVWSMPDFYTSLHDYRITVVVHIARGTPDARFGVVLDYRSDDLFWAVMFTENREWTIVERTATSWATAKSGKLAWSPEVFDQIDRTYQVSVDVQGNTVKLFLEGELVAETLMDRTLAGGRWGLIAQAGHGYLDLSFDDVIVFEPARG